ncbi:hypothetical protein VXI92_004589 [Enterobacter hormaechei]|nr:hypothetical protein [Enterobacter hormaechei]
MALKRGEASALMTKLVSESMGYTTTLAGLLILNIIIFRKGYDTIGTAYAVIFICCAIALFCYWVGHLVQSCVDMKNQHPGSREASIQAFIIMMCMMFSYIAVLVITIFTLKDQFHLGS